MTEVTVKKPFPYAKSLTETVQTEEGDIIDVADDIIPGLVEEGFIVAPPKSARAPKEPAAKPAPDAPVRGLTSDSIGGRPDRSKE